MQYLYSFSKNKKTNQHTKCYLNLHLWVVNSFCLRLLYNWYRNCCLTATTDLGRKSSDKTSMAFIIIVVVVVDLINFIFLLFLIYYFWFCGGNLQKCKLVECNWGARGLWKYFILTNYQWIKKDLLILTCQSRGDNIF